MQEFNIDKYRQFIKTKITKLYNKKGSLTEEEIINYCSQFTKTVQEFFPDKNQSVTQQKLRRIFSNNLLNKPKAVKINNYFLYEYGFIKCNICKNILHKSNFYKQESYWNGHKHYCKNCQKNTRNLQHNRDYIKKNRGKYNAHTAKYRASKIKATPKWLTNEQLLEIENLYKKAKLLNLEVDHIIPLQGQNVSGLHVPWNLQLLSKKDNAKKGNNIKEEEIYAGEPLICK